MNRNQTELSYRRAAVQETTTTAGLMIILYDMLAGDLRHAITAMRSGRIEQRSLHLKHAFAILQLLEGSLDREKGGDTAQSLMQFYSHIRGQLLQAQFERDEKLLEEQIALILHVREAWQQVDGSAKRPLSARVAAAGQDGESDPVVQEAKRHAGWSV